MIRIFQQHEIHAALEHATSGGQALHLMSGRWAYLRPDTPGCFKGRREIAHLFDQDKARLVATARRLGVRVILIERPGTQRQHIDLCGRPLERAKQEAKCPLRLCQRATLKIGLPCMMDIHILAGLTPACEVCGAGIGIARMREASGFRPVEGGFYISDNLAADQIRRLQDEIARRNTTVSHG
ncbi:hypothetical protein OPIT5_29380 [Opitutaceae bacterium TAV5]|nr:hypothetical protein OPIT5_21740 [Opitutaceae bacterium TAV5]AHF94892.1 hypothetical protein OPIT5_29380 [Opitutaceae bacterium TAV5]